MPTTIYELPPPLFSRAVPVYAEAWCDRAHIDAALQGREPGRMFVDDVENPTAAVLVRSYEYFAGGEPAESLRQFIRDTPAEPDIFQHIYGLVAVSDSWQVALLQDLGARVEIVPRRNFTWGQADVAGWEARVPGGMRVVPLDSALADRVNTEIYDYAPLLTYFWGSTDLEANGQFGYCALAGETLAGVCHSVSVSATQVNLAVETAETFRRRGVALAVCQAMIVESLRRGLLPTWDADGNNLPSVGLARKLGFVEGKPFGELATPGRASWSLSEGIWVSSPGEHGVTVWSRG
ncbi:MAG: GNAT family N-acetyltransferase [Anaerolineaceae bacterium]|nr:GNAT family N-acetyltransferase [Anaerolineaceae bacterium]